MTLAEYFKAFSGIPEFDALTDKQKALVVIRIAAEDVAAFRARVVSTSNDVFALPDIVIDSELGGTGLGAKVGVL